METLQPGAFTLAQVPEATEDPLYRLMREFRADSHEKKIDLGIGAYRDGNGKPWIMPAVKKVHSCLFMYTICNGTQYSSVPRLTLF